MSFRPNPLPFRITTQLVGPDQIAFSESFAFVKYDPRPALEGEPDEEEEDGPAPAASSLDVVGVYIDGRDDIDPEWWEINDVRDIGTLRLAVLRFHGPGFTNALYGATPRDKDRALLNALIDGTRIQLRVKVGEHPSALFVDVVSR